MYQMIAIERQYGSGGNEIGKRAAKELGYELYDRNILVEAAKKLGVPLVYVEELEETSPGGIVFNLSQTALGGSIKDESKMPLASRLFLEERRIVEEVASKGNCIIVGRCASFILRERNDCLNVFIHADKAFRLKRAMEQEGVKPSEAEDVLRKNDKRRSGFFNTNTQWKWGDPEYFPLCLDSSRLGMDLCTRLLVEAVRKSG